MSFKAYVPLYPPEGGPCSGFQCRMCPDTKRAVTRTRRGIILHLYTCHGVTLQKEFTFEGEKRESVPVEAKDPRDLSTDLPK